MTFIEVNDLLLEFDQINSLNNLEIASFNASLIQQEKAKESYDKIYKEITGEEISYDYTNDFKRYRMISKRLKLRYPKELDELK